MDVRTVISAHAQLLRSFCTNAQQASSYAAVNTLASSLVSAKAMPSSLVAVQVNIQTETLKSTSQAQLSGGINAFRLVASSTHEMSGLGTNFFLYIPSNESSTASSSINVYQRDNNSTPCYCLTIDKCAMPAALYSTRQMPTFGFYNLGNFANQSIPITGIQVGCFPIDGLLASTLECYYNRSCLELIISNSTSFSPLLSTLSSRFPRNATVEMLVDEVMVEDWSINTSFAAYYAECAPNTCTYSYNQRNDFLIIFTTILALIGGLNTVLRLLVPFIVQLIIQIKQRFRSSNDITQPSTTAWAEERSRLDNAKEKIAWLWLKVKMLNLFDSNSNDPSTQKHERQTTRLYILSLVIAFIILFFYAITIEETKVYTIQNPSREIYDETYAEYSKTLECTCSKIAIPYSTFISIETSYHQICSSSLISPNFFAQLAAIKTDIPYYPGDFMLMSVEYFQWFYTFCALAQQTLYQQLLMFQATLFVNNKLLAYDTFDDQATQLVDSFIINLQYVFSRGIGETRQMMGFAQPVSAVSDITYKFQFTTTPSGSQVQIEPIDFFSGCWCVVDYWQSRTYYLSEIPPMLNSTIPSRFNSSTLFSSMVEELMVENWTNLISYDSYFNQCAPQYCTYSVTQRGDILFLVTILLGLFGGCCYAFRRNLSEFHSRLVQLNLFYNRYKSSEITLQRERYSTRLYLIFLIIGMLTLLFYYSWTQLTITVSIKNPTQQVYENLLQSKEISALQCPCSHVTIPYGKFVQVNTSIHEVCSSPFIEQEWIKSIFGNGDWSNLSLNDFYGRGVVYFQGLYSFCVMYQGNMVRYASTFLSSSLISAQVITQIQLISQVNDTIEQIQAISRVDRSSLWKCGRDLINDNQILSIYSTNWIFSPIKYNPNLIGLPIPLKPVSHGNCSCATSSACVEPVYYNGQIVLGFVVGCHPMQSLFQSTLICLYNQSCVDQININQLPVTSLIASSNNQYPINRTIEQLIDAAFDEQWSVDIDYPRFFNECQPTTCVYSISARRDSIQIIITLLGFYGVVLEDDFAIFEELDTCK
ncbi:unnamed protein product [Rotaria sp. Silwood1]|nr:unnamed protein product [Rotaria sp. Silwood1]CAF1645111.1 unnamed protein product [Rotaria sp. Silwood1]CAF3788352.1 unnamed protein product [Rotaria sp. Silwood1]CAF3837129.1 unnamed protein product [Rotaria sp. Silwood1]